MISQHNHRIKKAATLGNASLKILQILTRAQYKAQVGFGSYHVIGKKTRTGTQAIAVRLGRLARRHLRISGVRICPGDRTACAEFIADDIPNRQPAGCRRLPVVRSGDGVIARSGGRTGIEIH